MRSFLVSFVFLVLRFGSLIFRRVVCSESLFLERKH